MNEEHMNLAVHIQPNARQNRVMGFKEDVLYLRIAAPPVGGKANLELVKYLSDILGISKGRVSIRKGTTTKRKLIKIDVPDRNRVMRIIIEQLEKDKSR